MSYETKNNSGSLFKNDKREKDSHPNAKGKALIDGQWFWVSSWTKETRDGAKWQSLSFQPFTDEQVAKYAGGQQGGNQKTQRQPERSSNAPAKREGPLGQPVPTFANSDDDCPF